ncbi:hypothetical protein QNO07_21005 [Streptomyces sp. 549]|uniref:hypothetical protein n=1 Tax=Streptomyces sp. 549 TaxID=3049076 RepID=UPI0024C33B88|nr:hypothetical protein [Streptomyces sp. 549]MDK1475864.1 hypothetical protein [Streptomyces sp. 549]
MARHALDGRGVEQIRGVLDGQLDPGSVVDGRERQVELGAVRFDEVDGDDLDFVEVGPGGAADVRVEGDLEERVVAE